MCWSLKSKYIQETNRSKHKATILFVEKFVLSFFLKDMPKISLPFMICINYPFQGRGGPSFSAINYVTVHYIYQFTGLTNNFKITMGTIMLLQYL